MQEQHIEAAGAPKGEVAVRPDCRPRMGHSGQAEMAVQSSLMQSPAYGGGMSVCLIILPEGDGIWSEMGACSTVVQRNENHQGNTFLCRVDREEYMAMNFNDWNEQNIREFRASGGKLGGSFEGAPVLLLHTFGRKSGTERVNPLMYLPFEDRVFIFASKAGAPEDPDWYRNLLAHPDVPVEIGAETRMCEAREVQGTERARIYDEQAERYPQFAEYQNKTSREIPVIELVQKS